MLGDIMVKIIRGIDIWIQLAIPFDTGIFYQYEGISVG